MARNQAAAVVTEVTTLQWESVGVWTHLQLMQKLVRLQQAD